MYFFVYCLLLHILCSLHLRNIARFLAFEIRSAEQQISRLQGAKNNAYYQDTDQSAVKNNKEAIERKIQELDQQIQKNKCELSDVENKIREKEKEEKSNKYRYD